MLIKQKRVYIALAEVLTVFVMFALVSNSLAQNSPWVRKANMQNGRHSYTASVVDGKIYVVGGRYTLNLLTEYDPATDTWATKESMPSSRMVLSSCAVNGKIYAIGGLTSAFETALSTVEEYDPTTNTWTKKKNMPTPRLGLGTSVVDGKIYAIGGMSSGSNFWSGMRDTVEIYDPETDSWSIGSSMPTPRCWFTTSVVNGKIYVIGGALVSKRPISNVEVYDPETDTWATKASMPTARMSHAAAVIDGIIYVIGGGTENGQPVGGYSVVEAYDPENDTWIKKAEMPVPRASIFAPELDGKIYVIGGIPNFADPHLEGTKTVYEYNPSRDLSELIDQVNLNKYFAQAGNDSICIKIKLKDPAGVTLFAEIQSPDQSPLESLQLFDDGNHNDGSAGDSLYANLWRLSSTEEQQYYVDLQVTRSAVDTIVHNMNNVTSFTTIGPVIFENYTFRSSDIEPNPGDNLYISITLKNEGAKATALNVDARIISLDTLSTVNIDDYKPFGDIAPGESKYSIFYYGTTISENCPENTEVPFALDITSNNYTFWIDTFSIFVVQPSTTINTRENSPRKFVLNQNYSNPFNPTTNIEFSIPNSEFVTLNIYNILGEEVTTLVSDRLPAGSYSYEWDASNLASGVYLYRLQAGNYVQTRKMVLMK
jgi:N-acetylneuraminic acid mutarotase